MDTLKKFAKYVILIVVFYFFSNILIFVGLNSNYDKIKSSGNTPSQVQMEQAEATLVNGRMKGKIINDGDEDLNGKYMKVDLYSARNTLLGTDYVEIKDLEKGATDNFELYFKGQDVDHYDISFVDKPEEIEALANENEEGTNFFDQFKIKTEFMKRELTKQEILLAILFLGMFIV